MKFTVAASLAVLASQASAHYIFQTFDTATPYQYVRVNANKNSPVTDVKSLDLRCNVGGAKGNVSTLSVAAGSAHTFGLDTAVYHQGPVFL